MSDSAAEPWQYTGPESLTVKCTRPIKLTDKDPNVLTEFTLTEPTVEQMAAFIDKVNKTQNDMLAGTTLISMNSGITEAQAKKLSTRDFQEAIKFLTGFTPPLPKDGAS